MAAEKILIVDDDQTTSRVLELQLTKMGYSIVGIAKSADEALKYAKKFSPQLVLMDINLGQGMDGIETASAIIKDYEIPVIYITAYADDDTLGRAKETNPSGFINKPIRKNDLRANVEIALNRASHVPAYQQKPAKDLIQKFQITCDPNGEIGKISTQIQKILDQHKLNSINDILPTDHDKHVSNCLKHQKPQLLTGKIKDKILSWEYRPLQSGKGVRVTIAEISGQDGFINISVDQAPLSEALDHLASGVILTNEHLKVFYRNKSAEKILQISGSAIKIKDGHLTCSTPEITAELHRLVLETSGNTFSLNRGGKVSPLHMLVSPLTSHANNFGRDLPIAVMFLFETVNDAERIEDVIRMLYNLSPTEAKIAARLVFNPHLEEVASSLGITYNTARTHLKRVYIKTDTNRLSSLVHRIVTGPVGILIHSRD